MGEAQLTKTTTNSAEVMEPDLDLEIFALLAPEQIFYLVAFQQEEIHTGVGSERTGPVGSRR
jgi:hypothetical protein